MGVYAERVVQRRSGIDTWEYAERIVQREPTATVWLWPCPTVTANRAPAAEGTGMRTQAVALKGGPIGLCLECAAMDALVTHEQRHRRRLRCHLQAFASAASATAGTSAPHPARDCCC